MITPCLGSTLANIPPPMPTSRPYDDAPRLPESTPLDPASVFGGSEGSVELEVGPGRGGFVFERVETRDDVRIIGLEVRRKWAAIVDARLRSRGLDRRARVFAEDVREVLPRLRAASIARVFVHFPDPWWKKRHRKRLVVTEAFAQEVARVLTPGGELFVQTDVLERTTEYEQILAKVPELEPAMPSSGRLGENPFGAQSPRERRAVADGLPIYRLLYRRACP
jgi:tRNA (guanine-N7-)-methyltransferase